ncbi:hypothetical protein [Paenibacillus wynnii]|uniref:hypothetical protein n=1 Tax=Paenibacillus wynnii TaxID=268407 RepID=UPI002792E0C9|nr:hypothetical protein [Paenibacillus wynnii]MDQ0193749.1 hypothetical protein [Paenibacillus wynnii]
MEEEIKLVNMGGHECFLSVIATLLRTKGLNEQFLLSYTWRFYLQRDFGELQVHVLTWLNNTKSNENESAILTIGERLNQYGYELSPATGRSWVTCSEKMLSNGQPILLYLPTKEYAIVTDIDRSANQFIIITGNDTRKKAIPFSQLINVKAYLFVEVNSCTAAKELQSNLIVGLDRLTLLEKLTILYGLVLKFQGGSQSLREKVKDHARVIVVGDTYHLPFTDLYKNKHLPRYFIVEKYAEGQFYILDPLSETKGWYAQDEIEKAYINEGNSCWTIEWRNYTPITPGENCRKAIAETVEHMEQQCFSGHGFRGMEQLIEDMNHLRSCETSVINQRLQIIYSQLSNINNIRDQVMNIFVHGLLAEEREFFVKRYEDIRKYWMIMKPLMVRSLVRSNWKPVENVQAHLLKIIEMEKKWLNAVHDRILEKETEDV